MELPVLATNHPSSMGYRWHLDCVSTRGRTKGYLGSEGEGLGSGFLGLREDSWVLEGCL